MNVIMLLDNNISPGYHNDIRRSKQRSQPRPARESAARSKSLSRKEEERQERQGHLKTRKMSSSTHQLASVRAKEESVEVPVIVDDVTKWISGVNRSTTCRDVITVILKRSSDQFKVLSRFLPVKLNTPIWTNC